jgi:hypothetical protein
MDLDISMTFDVRGLVAALNEADKAIERNVRQELVFSASSIVLQARGTHDYRDRTRNLTSSIHEGKLTGSWASGTLTVSVIADAQYAAAIEYGSRPHEIVPRRRKYLRFAVGGRVVFAKKVHHPGTRAYEFLAKALEAQMPEITENIANAMERSLRSAGL